MGPRPPVTISSDAESTSIRKGSWSSGRDSRELLTSERTCSCATARRGGALLVRPRPQLDSEAHALDFLELHGVSLRRGAVGCTPRPLAASSAAKEKRCPAHPARASRGGQESSVARCSICPREARRPPPQRGLTWAIAKPYHCRLKSGDRRHGTEGGEIGETSAPSDRVCQQNEASLAYGGGGALSPRDPHSSHASGVEVKDERVRVLSTDRS